MRLGWHDWPRDSIIDAEYAELAWAAHQWIYVCTLDFPVGVRENMGGRHWRSTEYARHLDHGEEEMVSMDNGIVISCDET